MMLDHYQRMERIRKEIGEDFKLMESITMFRHLDLRTQDKFIQTISDFPLLKSFLLEAQQSDEMFFITHPITKNMEGNPHE